MAEHASPLCLQPGTPARLQATLASLTVRLGCLRRLLVLLLVVAVHGMAVRLLLQTRAGSPIPGAARVLQVSWLEGEAAPAQAGGPSAPSMPASPAPASSPPREEKKPQPTTPRKPVLWAKPRADVPVSPSTTGKANAVSADTGRSHASPATAASPLTRSEAGGDNGATGTAKSEGSAGTSGYSAPRFDAAYLANPPPEYPALSREMGEEGRVFLRVQVSAQGRPLQIGVYKSSGHTRLDSAALDAVRRWRFIPGHSGDEAVIAHVIVPINFFLE